MKVLLCSRGFLAYGQDFLNAGIAQHCSLSKLYKEGEKFIWPFPGTDPELVVTQNPDDPADSSFIARFAGEVPSVVHIHYRWDYFSEVQKKNISRTLEFATAGVVPADFLKREMEALFPRVKWYSVANGVRDDLFRPSTNATREEFRERHLLKKDTKVVGFTGRLENAKGIQILEAICNRIDEEPFSLFIQFPDWQAIRDQEKVLKRYYAFADKLKALNPRKVVIWGDQSPRFNNRPVRFFDVFLTTSLSEVQPLVVLEALVSGVPVVATNSTPVFREIQERIPTTNVPPKWLQIEPLPDRLNQGATASNSSLTKDESLDLADRLIACVNDVDVYSDRKRELLSSILVKTGFTEASMNSKLSDVYQEVIQIFKNDNN